MPLFSIQLDSGREIMATACYKTETYEGGLAIGKHSKERSERKLDSVEKFAQSVMHSPVHILLPESMLVQPPEYCWPYFTIITLFLSKPVDDTDRGGSQLAVIHFQDVLEPYFTDSNLARLQELPWEALAEDFDY